MIQEFFEDARYAVRAIRGNPWLATVITTTQCVAIGVSTALFGIANSILIRPLPYSQSDRIDWISEISGPARQDLGVARKRRPGAARQKRGATRRTATATMLAVIVPRAARAFRAR